MHDPNENRPEYKKTKVGWIPEEWVIHKLKEVCYIDPDTLPESTKSDLELLYIDISCIKSGRFCEKPVPVLFGSAPSRARRLFAKGDVIMSTVRPNLKGFIYIDFNPKNHVCSTGYSVLRPRSGTLGLYLFYSLFSEVSSKYFHCRTVGTGYPALNSSDVNQLSVLLPTLPEQHKIACILSIWDNALDRLHKLIKAKKLQKKGLMQQLLSGEKRLPGFEGEWVIRKYKDLFKKVERPIPLQKDSNYRLASIRRNAGGFFDRGSARPDEISYTELNILHENDFVISKRQVTHGAMAVVPEFFKDSYVSNEYTIFVRKNEGDLSMNFFQWMTQTKYLWHQAYVSSNGVHIEKLIFDPKHFLRQQIEIPIDTQEQTAIANVLDTADREIKNLEAKLAALETQKKGLMQRLLTGQIRVQVDAA
ncbi:MAG: restriction endonuclease subunit S [Opitutales bacterium]